MRTVIAGVVFAAVAFAQADVSGEWALTVLEFERPMVMRLSLNVEGGKLTGKAGFRPVEGTVDGSNITFKIVGDAAKGVVEGTTMSGDITMRGRAMKWSAVRIPPRPAQPRVHDFEPKVFHLYFSSAINPALRVHPGDTVRTWGVDAGGVDHKGQRRSPGGNPQTGPFYIEGALPGDTLVVKLNRVRTNRDWAVSGNQVLRSALEPGSNLKWEPGVPSRWKIDADKGIAYLEKPTDSLKNFTVPLTLMVGCIGTAPEEGWSIRTRDSGRFGGNMDYNQIREGTTVYLPVYHPGALLFIGDGHAAQGDGELTGDALETSMEFEFTVDVIARRRREAVCGERRIPDEHRHRRIAPRRAANGHQRIDPLAQLPSRTHAI
jgi:amidase